MRREPSAVASEATSLQQRLFKTGGGTVVGVTKSLTLDLRKGTIQDFLMEEEGILIGLLRTTPPRQPGGRDLRPGVTAATQ